MAGYLVKYGSNDVYVPGSDSYAIHGAKLTMKTDAVSQFQFTMPPTHPLRNTIALRHQSNLVRVWFDDVLLFTGYVTRASETITGELVVTCSSELAMLNDVHVRLTDLSDVYSDEQHPTGNVLFQWLIEAYNAKVAAARRFTIGHNISASAIGALYYGLKRVEANTTTPATVLELISRCILDPYGCVLKVWYEGSTRYVGLYTAAPDTNNQTITFGENMKSLDFDTSDDDLYTGCYPIGGTGTDYSGSTNVATFHLTRALAENAWNMRIDAGSQYEWVGGDEDRKITHGDVFVIAGISFKALGGMVNGEVDVTPVNKEADHVGSPTTIASGTAVYYKGHSPSDGKKFTTTLKDVANGTYETDYQKTGAIVYDKAAVTRYGLKTFTFTEDLYYAPNLLNRAIELLKQHASPTYTLTVDAVDMALYNTSKTHLLAGQKVRVISVPHNIDVTMQVTQADLDMDNPGNTTYTLGAYKGSVTRMVRGNERDIDGVREALQSFKLDVVQSSDIWGLA